MKKTLILILLIFFSAQVQAEKIYSRWYCSNGKVAEIEDDRSAGQLFLTIDGIHYPVTQFQQTNYGMNIYARRNINEVIIMDAFDINGPMSGKMNYSGSREGEDGFTGECVPDRNSQIFGEN